MSGSLPHLTLGVWRISGAFSDALSHYGIGVFFILVQFRLRDVKKFNVRVSWLKIVDKTA